MARGGLLLHRGDGPTAASSTGWVLCGNATAPASGQVLGAATTAEASATAAAATAGWIGRASASGRVLGTATAAAEAATVRVVRLGLRFRAEKKGESENYYQRCGHYQRELAAQRDSQPAAATPFVDKGVVVCTQPYADPLPTDPEVPYGTSKTIRVNMIPSQLASVT